MRASRYLILLLFTVVMTTQCLEVHAQYRRRDIATFSSADQLELRQLIMAWLTSSIVNQHASLVGTIHCENTLFMSWHRDYVAELEAWLMTQNNGTKYVPLPKWIPSACTGIPNAFFNSLVGPGSAVMSGWPTLVNQNICAFGNFNFAPFASATVCSDFPSGTMVRACTGSSFGTAEDNFALALERQHNNVHGDIGGVMNDAMHSPAAAIFWLWHGYVDDIYRYYECKCLGAHVKDLYMKDNAEDVGDEANTTSPSGVLWESPDIWVRQDADPVVAGKYQHEDDILRNENPEYKALGGYNYVYVRIRNRGCNPVTLGEVQLHVNWSKWSPGVWTWPADWITLPQGSEITPGAGINVPTLNPGEQWVAEVPWTVPDPAAYPIDPHHFCLLARLTSGVDPMHTAEGLDVYANTKENNNIAWRNVQVYDSDPFNIVGPGTGGFATFNVRATRANFREASLKFSFAQNPALHAVVDLGDDLHRLWVDGGARGNGITRLEGNQIRIDAPDARIDGLALAADGIYRPAIQVYTALNAQGGRMDVKLGDVNLFRVIQFETTNENVEAITGGITVEVRNVQSDATTGAQITSVTVTQPSCPTSSDGGIKVATVEKPSDITVWWSNGASTKDISNVAPGTYTIVVRSNISGRAETRDVVVTSRSTLDAAVDARNSTCGRANGTAVAAATGGRPPYTYQWYRADGTAIQGANTRDLRNVAKGLYSVDVRDASGCTVGRSIWVDDDMSMLDAFMSKGDASSATARDGWAQADAVGMMEPFTFLWSNGGTTNRIDNLRVGNYSVLVTDAMGCTLTKQVTITSPQNQLQGVDPNDVQGGVSIVSIVPNPTSKESQVSYMLKRSGTVRIEIFDEMGKLVQFVEEGPKNAGDNSTRIDTRGIASGRYALRITFDGNVNTMPFVVVR